MLAGHFTTCAGISEREGAREGRDEEREITSHPAPSRLNYSNLTHMGWPPRQRESGGEPPCGGRRGDPCSGRSLILPLAEVPEDRFDVWLPSECSLGAC